MPNIHKPLTFGLELECTKIAPSAPHIMRANGFSNHYDATIFGDNGETLPMSISEGGGTEIVTQPIEVGIDMAQDGKNLRIDFRDGPDRVRALCDCAQSVNKSCGLHVHLGRPATEGRSLWEPERVRTMLAIGLMLEDRLFPLCPPSRIDCKHCKKIRSEYSVEDLKNYYPMGQPRARKMLNPKRYCWLNLIETRRRGTTTVPYRQESMATGTLEIRMLGNTKRFEYVWSWIQLWIQIGAYVAYLPSSLAMMHSCFSGSVDPTMDAIAKAKEAINKEQPMEPAMPVREASISFPPIRRTRRRAVRPTAPAEPETVVMAPPPTQ